MSIAGIQSNRGDSYQTCVALGWAITVLSDPNYQWLEVDSIHYPVDDVVIGKTDGSLICCQCKKNQQDFNAWKISDLSDELKKASSLLATNKKAEVRFYSRSPFGSIAKLREFSTTQDDETSYQRNLTPEHKKTDDKLRKTFEISAPTLTSFEFLRRTIFTTSDELCRMEEVLHERLRGLVSNPVAAYIALWRDIDQLGARMNNSTLSIFPHRYQKEDLTSILLRTGAMLARSVNLNEVRRSFEKTSAIGRVWKRDIAGKQINRPMVNELLLAIDERKRSILLTGTPGSGKTCVILAVQEALEERAQTHKDIIPLFIQAREFADLLTITERNAHGLTEQWVKQAARLADEIHVVVVIDSLDVLSISREHSILKYFLAQIDQLLLVPNITILTACRDFDRKYDRQIAQRKWDAEFKCIPLNWEVEVAPLLTSLDIKIETMDLITRELIQNPRELALFVELAKSEGSFNVVTSQALAQRYLDDIVRNNNALGEQAIITIEAIADEMLNTRCSSVPHQRFNASPEIKRNLCSLNVLQETQDGKLMFGHQTLLDVLVISRAIRNGVTLNEFIKSLPPVPFVRPSIRSFVAQLAAGDRKIFRSQLRTVLTSDAAFHIRRLVTETFAEQVPHKDDWALIRDLHDNNPEVFQSIYTKAMHIEWYHFWKRYLFPKLKDTRDKEKLSAFVYMISKWKNEDTEGVVSCWIEVLSLDWFECAGIVENLAYYLTEINNEKTKLVTPLIEKLICMPKGEYSVLGHTIARCLQAGEMDDSWLWRFIISDLQDIDVIENNLGKKLHCQPDTFGNNTNDFLCSRMIKSANLLDLALQSIEQWSLKRSEKYHRKPTKYRNEFLRESSYSKVHSQDGYHHVDNVYCLLHAIESAIMDHACSDTDWWKFNKAHLCSNYEGTLRYFAILACTKAPQTNIPLIERILSDTKIFDSNFAYEVGNLINASFIYLSDASQESTITHILSMWNKKMTDEDLRLWQIEIQAKLISNIPCYLRSPMAQKVLDVYLLKKGVLDRSPEIHCSGGSVMPPFSYHVFLNCKDDSVLKLLAHYTGVARCSDNFWVGGEWEVGLQLSEAASRHPIRFVNLMSNHWDGINAGYKYQIMSGISRHLLYLYGNLQKNSGWAPNDEPDASELASLILDELENHSSHWYQNHDTSAALEACANVITDEKYIIKFITIALRFDNSDKDDQIEDLNYLDLINTGINMSRGKVAEALIILADRLYESKITMPETLTSTLGRFAQHKHPAVRALVLYRLPFLIYHNPGLGWELFHFAIEDDIGLWQYAERCLYHNYRNHFEKVAPFLARIYNKGNSADLETWGRISALAAFDNSINLNVLIEDLKSRNVAQAWQGAASVWSHFDNFKKHSNQCLKGLDAAFVANGPHNVTIAQDVENLFTDDNTIIQVPIRLVKLYFNALEKDSNNKRHTPYRFAKWLNLLSIQNPNLTLECCDVYLDYIKKTKPTLYDHDNNFAQLITHLFAEAEEREDSDNGKMLQRVISIQDSLLALGLESINSWLKAAERP